MDEIDQAHELEELHRSASLKAARNRTPYPPQHTECGKVFCIDCGVEVPPKRLEIEPNTPWCVECQEFNELQDKC